MFARWGVTEWGTTTFLKVSLLGNEIILSQQESINATKHKQEEWQPSYSVRH